MPLCVKSSCSSSFISTASVTSLWRKTFTSICNLHTPRPRHSHSRLGHTLIIIIMLNLVPSVQKIPRVQQWVDRKPPHLNCVATLPWETGKNCSTFTKVTVKTRRSTKMMLRHVSHFNYVLVRPSSLTSRLQSLSFHAVDHFCRLTSKLVELLSNDYVDKFGKRRTDRRTDMMHASGLTQKTDDISRVILKIRPHSGLILSSWGSDKILNWSRRWDQILY